MRDEEELKEKLGDFVSSTAGDGEGGSEVKTAAAAASAAGGGQGQLKFARPTRPGGKKR